MAILLFPSILLGIIICLVFSSARRMQRIGAGEEWAHAMALERRNASTDRRRERRTAANRSATAAILGSDEDGADCLIVNISRSGMRIAIAQPLPIGAQVNVARDKEFFIGSVCYSAADRDGYVVGLRLISSNH